MNENINVMSVVAVVVSQLQGVKEKLDPEVYELLNKSGHEAIASAQHFLDACEIALDSLVEVQNGDANVQTTSEDNGDNILNFNAREA